LQGRTHPEGCVEDAGPNGPSRTPVQTDSRGRLSLRGERVITKSAQIQKLRRLLPPLAWSPSLSEGGCCNIVPGNRRRRRAPEDPCDSKDARAKHGQQPCRLLRPFAQQRVVHKSPTGAKFACEFAEKQNPPSTYVNTPHGRMFVRSDHFFLSP